MHGTQRILLLNQTTCFWAFRTHLDHMHSSICDVVPEKAFLERNRNLRSGTVVVALFLPGWCPREFPLYETSSSSENSQNLIKRKDGAV